MKVTRVCTLDSSKDFNEKPVYYAWWQDDDQHEENMRVVPYDWNSLNHEDEYKNIKKHIPKGHKIIPLGKMSELYKGLLTFTVVDIGKHE